MIIKQNSETRTASFVDVPPGVVVQVNGLDQNMASYFTITGLVTTSGSLVDLECGKIYEVNPEEQCVVYPNATLDIEGTSTVEEPQQPRPGNSGEQE